MTGHIDTPTSHVDVDGISYAYRRFGPAVGTPLLFLQHFRAGMDHWDLSSPTGSPQAGP